MILVTGGAGFIGSNLHAALVAAGRAVVVADWLARDGKWRNLRAHPPLEIVAPENLPAWLERRPPLEAIVHLGAISETTASDGDLTWATNVTLSQYLWRWCADNNVQFLYASSAATYGDGRQGFDDEQGTRALSRLRPLNLYGWTKHAFDLWAFGEIEANRPRPPHWAGLKFFNAYGPNEYHKGKMISVVKVKHDEVAAGGAARLFRSDQPGLADGEQKRDFIWIDDVIAIIKFLLTTKIDGLFNCGSGRARSYADVARAVCVANGRPERIEFVDMPAHLRGQYQSFTEARMERLREAGLNLRTTSLEEGVSNYIQNFLARPDPYV